MAHPIWLRKFKVRLTAAYRILFRKYNHWVILNITNEGLTECLKDNPVDIDVLYHGLQPYVYWKIIKELAESKDEIDMALDKAQFEADSMNTKK